MWSQLSPAIQKRSGLRDQFLHAASRENRYKWVFSPLYSAIDRTFSIAMAFYRENRRTEVGILDESSFFKHRNLPKEFAAFLSSRANASKAKAIALSLSKFERFLKSVEADL